jgi:benzoyl-CoA 2,3-dioxygenase component B
MFTFFTDRDGKYQLASLASSAFDPLSRTVQFMLREEAHHMFIGTTGIARVVQRTCELMRQHGADGQDVRRHGGIELDLLQKYINLHYSVSLDLFGSELSSNAATYFSSGLKGRFQEAKRDDDHQLVNAVYAVPGLDGGRIRTVEAPALNAMNECLRDDYIVDCQRGLSSWNKIIARAGVDFELRLPHRGFNRQVGVFAGARVSPDGQVLDDLAWEARSRQWLPTDQDREYVGSLMTPVTEPGKMANWIAPPATGINGKPIEFEYVRFEPRG